MLIDSHSHITDMKEYTAAIGRARQKKVEKIVSNGTDWKSNLKNKKICENFDILYPCYGLHPKNCLEQTKSKNQETIEWIQKQFEQDAKAAIGEIGLDFFNITAGKDKKKQEYWFEKQLDLAIQFEKPVTIHARNALSQAIETANKKNVSNALFHWFDGNEQELNSICEKNFFISIGPAVLSQKKIQEIAKKARLENLLLETDCPVQFNGKPSEPAWIPEIAKKISEIRNESIGKIALKTTQNARKFFKF